MLKLISPLALFMAAVSQSFGAVYTDDFSTNPGSLNGRSTAAGFGDWVSNPALGTGVGTGIYQNGVAPYPTASFALPLVDSTSLISVSLTMKPTGSDNNFIGFGFTNDMLEPVTTKGNALTYLFGAGSTSTSPGLVSAQSGFGAGGAGQLNYSNPFTSFDSSLSTTITMSYVVASGQITLSALNNGQSVTVYDGFVNWTPNGSGTGPNPVPYPTYFQYFTIQFQDQTTGTLGGNISNLSVSVVPEPNAATYLIGAAGVFFGIHFYRRRRVSQS